MSVTTTNLVQGPGTLYVGDFQATEPAESAVNTAPAASAWTDVGGTQDGLKLSVDQAWAELEVDQLITTPGRRRTKQDYMVETTMAEATLENLALALNGGTAGSGTGYKSYTPDYASTSATQPTYKSLILDGWAPDSKRRRAIVRKVLSTDGIEIAYTKENQTVYAVKWGAHWVSANVSPIYLVDEDPA
ncbi:hypothetical protein H1X69_12410 [Streptomyces griseoaurantiacus]|uniref:Major tail protein n=1 Tax=Streptomyces griseoaurantiacus TaxID=68213 RepID=A0A7W2HUM1_9ACTN|nr:hypothetical protein [Streptomyces griseoaurantiacus]